MAQSLNTDSVEKISKIYAHTEYMRGKLETHLEDKTIHHHPGCEDLKSFKRTVWAAFFFSIAAIVGSMFSIIRTIKGL